MKKVTLGLLTLGCMAVATTVFAQAGGAGSAIGIGKVAATATSNLANLARLITAVAYVAGMAFVVGAIVKFKAHKDNPTQIPIGTPIALLFVGAGLMFAPSVFKASGQSLFGASGSVAGISGVTSFGVQKPTQ